MIKYMKQIQAILMINHYALFKLDICRKKKLQKKYLKTSDILMA